MSLTLQLRLRTSIWMVDDSNITTIRQSQPFLRLEKTARPKNSRPGHLVFWTRTPRRPANSLSLPNAMRWRARKCPKARRACLPTSSEMVAQGGTQIPFQTFVMIGPARLIDASSSRGPPTETGRHRSRSDRRLSAGKAETDSKPVYLIVSVAFNCLGPAIIFFGTVIVPWSPPKRSPFVAALSRADAAIRRHAGTSTCRHGIALHSRVDPSHRRR